MKLKTEDIFLINKIMGKKNPIAKTLRTPMFKKKVIKPKKGKGSFKRKKVD